MTKKPAVSVAPMPGRRKATIELAQQFERAGFGGIYCPSVIDNMKFRLGLPSPTFTLATRLIMRRRRRSFTNYQADDFTLVLVSVTGLYTSGSACK